MKKFLAFLLVLTVCFSVFAFTAFAKPVDVTFTVNNSTKSLSTHIEYANGMYYVSVSELAANGFTYSINDSEYVLTRYSTEIRIPKTGSTIYKNGAAATFENAVILPSPQNETFYISVNVLKDYFCSSCNISDTAIKLTLSAFSASATKTVSGTVSLAEGTASANMEYSVDVIGSNTFSAKVTIPAGSSSVAYTVPVYSSDSNFVIRCTQVNKDDVSGYTSTSYYAYNGTVTNPVYASSVGIASTVTANFAIPKDVTLTGDIEGDGEGYVLVENSDGDVVGATEFYSSSSSTYSVTIPGSTKDAFIRYKIYNGDGIVRYGYYGNSSVTAFEDDAVAQNLSFNSVFDMNILTGSTISGTINWANTNVSYCTVRAMTADGKYISDANIYLAGATDFSVVVPTDEYTDYVLVVNTDDSTYSKYVANGSLTSKLSEATVFDATSDVSGAAITIDSNAGSSVLYGQLKLPEGLVATEDMTISLYAGKISKNTSVANGAYSIAKTYTASATIPAGKSTADYVINLGTSYAGEKIALGYISGGSSVPNGYFDGYDSTLFSTDKDISFSAEAINNIDLYVLSDSTTDVTAITDGEGKDYSASSTAKETVNITLENLTNIDKTGVLFVGAYDSANKLIASSYENYSVEGSTSADITATLTGDISGIKFLKILTLDANNKLVARDIVIL